MHLEFGVLWVRRETRETLARMEEMAVLDLRVTVGNRAPLDPLDGWWIQDLELERRENLGTVDKRVLVDPRVILACLVPLERGALLGFGESPDPRGTLVFEAQQERRVIEAPLG